MNDMYLPRFVSNNQREIQENGEGNEKVVKNSNNGEERREDFYLKRAPPLPQIPL